MSHALSNNLYALLTTVLRPQHVRNSKTVDQKSVMKQEILHLVDHSVLHDPLKEQP